MSLPANFDRDHDIGAQVQEVTPTISRRGSMTKETENARFDSNFLTIVSRRKSVADEPVRSRRHPEEKEREVS